MPDMIRGALGDENYELDTNIGVLRIDGKDFIRMRTRLINRLFGSIMDIPMFTPLVKKAGLAAGENFATDWLLKVTPATLEVNEVALPPKLQQLSTDYFQLQEQIEKDPSMPGVIAKGQQKADEVDVALTEWLAGVAPDMIRAMWGKLHLRDVYSGWGKAEVIEFDRPTATATIRLTNSFIAREKSYWIEFGFGGRHVCSYFEGYYLGEAQVLFGRKDLNCIEEHCLLEGYETCTFRISPVN